MLKKKYIIIALGIVSVLLTSLFYNNITLAQNGKKPTQVDVTNLPIDEQGNLRVNVSNIAPLLDGQTTREIAIFEIPKVFQTLITYSKVGELAVPAGKKWYVYKITFAYFEDNVIGNLDYLKIRLSIRGVIMMDEVSVNSFPLNIPTQDNHHTLELRKPVELLEGEKIELWTRNSAEGYRNQCGLLIEAWVEEI